MTDDARIKVGLFWLRDGSRLVYAWETRLDPYHQHLTSIRPDGSDARELGAVQTVYAAPALSPDGRVVVFSGDGSEEGTSGLVLLDLVDGTRRQLTTDGATGAIWSPDGTRILAYLPSRRVEVIDATSGAELARILDAGVQWVVGWTPDGESIIYHGCGEDMGKVECGDALHFVARADGTDVRTYSGPEPLAPGSVLASPDGRWVLTTGPGGELRVSPSSGVASVGLGIGTDPSWSPDSAWVVFASGEAEPTASAEGSSNALVIVARGGGPVLGLTHARSDSKPAWRP